ncbi:MAG: SufE family protein [Cytophagales bacterium]|nr:MAG: SufE family protein [Cytophagales bacterium]
MANHSIEEKQNEIIDNFALLDSWEDKYAYLIELGKKCPPLTDEYKTDAYKIKGCQSNVWIHSYLQHETLIYEGDSDALIVKGLVSLLIDVFSGQTPQAIQNADLYFIEKIGMQQHLSMTRVNGLASMIKQMKLQAIQFQHSS